MITHLNIPYSIYSNEAINTAASNCSNLILLSVSVNCNNITDATIAIIERHCSRLQTLQLHNQPVLTDAALIALADGCPNLTSIPFNIHSGITAVGLSAFIVSHRAIKSYKFNNPKEECIVCVAENCKQLTQIIMCDELLYVKL